MSLPVITVAQMREWEQATWAAGQSETEVIRRVGEVVARRALELTRPGQTILLLGGHGHNGDDVRAARNLLRERNVLSFDVVEPPVTLSLLQPLLAQKPALIVEGLFGIGLNRPLDTDWCQIIRCVNDSRLPVLAVDIPSGLNADTGVPQPEAIRAAVTLTVGAPKIGLLKQSAWPFVGRLEVTPDVGLLTCPLRSESNWMLPEDFTGFPPARAAAAHKGNFGHLAIVAGSMGYHGAAVLAMRGAQRAQPGLVTLFPQSDVFHAVAAQAQAAMVSAWRPDVKLSVDFDAALIGPGLAAPNPSDELKNCLRRLWLGSPKPVVVDASGLDWIPLGPVSDKYVRVVTPHPGEVARLLGVKIDHIQNDRIGALRDLSKRLSNCWVVFKGHQTLIGRSTGDIFVNSTGNPHLAQGGAGDVLAGYLAGLLVQSALQADPLTTICYAVWQHGRAADKLTSERRNWTIEDLAGMIGNA